MAGSATASAASTIGTGADFVRRPALLQVRWCRTGIAALCVQVGERMHRCRDLPAQQEQDKQQG